MTPKEKAIEIVDKYHRIRLDILTRMDSIPTVLSDYPTSATAKMLAGYEVRACIEAVTSIADKKYEFYKEVENEINKLP